MQWAIYSIIRKYLFGNIYSEVFIWKYVLNKTIKTAVFTIVSLNYSAYAKTLMASLLAVHPEWERHVLIVDRCDDPASVGDALFAAMTVEDLPLPKMNEFLFRYGIMELNTAAKPYMFAHLRRQGYDRVVYIDPDILVLDRLVDVERLLDEGAAAVVTPHLTAPLDDDRRPSELDIMRAGAYNLGFLALGSLPASDAFIHWWEQKLEYGALSDHARGLFTDQKWVDLAPGMFGGFAILRDPGYNVAYWNLPHRPVTCENHVWLADGRPLRFFHFSGFDPLNPQPFSKHQDRLTLDTIGQARTLALDYASRVLAHGFAEARKQPYAFASFSDGTPILNALRVLYRDDPAAHFRAGANPFESADYFVNGEVDGLPNILRGVWLEHPHLQSAFPNPVGISRSAYIHWFADNGGVSLGTPEVFIAPVRVISTRLRADEARRITRTKQSGPQGPYKASIWARGLVFLHKRATGGRLSVERLVQYQHVTGPVDFFWLAYQRFQDARRAAKPGQGAGADPIQAAPARAHSAPLPRPVGRRTMGRFSGLYLEAADALWIGRQARFVVDGAPSAVVRLQGIHHDGLHQRANGSPVLKVFVGFNDAPQRAVTLKEGGHFDIEVDLAPLPPTWPAVLHIVPQASFIPKELGDSEDTRRLSIQIADISIGGSTVFNARDQSVTRGKAASAVTGVNIIGYARSEHGVGQSLRQFAVALEAVSIPHAVIDFNNNNNSRINDRTLESRIVKDAVYPVNVFHINADQMPDAEMHFPPDLMGRYNIGFWHWELPEMLDEHLSGFDCINEVWVPTGFIQEAVAKRSPVPVIRMPHAIHFTVSSDASRAQFKLPEDKFLFLMMFDFSSYQQRKNPQASLDAFDLAFGKAAASHPGRAACLVIKTQNAQFHEKDVAHIRARLAGRTDIIWINETLSRQEVYDLQSVCDCLVSLHRSEGYGLGPAEAMFLGKPVIATNWSGNTEFMRPQNSLPVNYTLVKIEKDVGVYKAGQYWANADIAHAASLMRLIVEDAPLRARISAEARRTMQEEYSPEVIGERILARLAYVQQVFLRQ
jgi:glycosyltransferase involved in cell wall biosynthesis